MSCDYGGGSPPPGGTVHVSAIGVPDSSAGSNTFLSTNVAIVGERSIAVSGATVDLTTALPDGSTAKQYGSGGAAIRAVGKDPHALGIRRSGCLVSAALARR